MQRLPNDRLPSHKTGRSARGGHTNCKEGASSFPGLERGMDDGTDGARAMRGTVCDVIRTVGVGRHVTWKQSTTGLLCTGRICHKHTHTHDTNEKQQRVGGCQIYVQEIISGREDTESTYERLFLSNSVTIHSMTSVETTSS